jgi:hypothetical protein
LILPYRYKSLAKDLEAPEVSLNSKGIGELE